jgi:hypothetical protein
LIYVLEHIAATTECAATRKLAEDALTLFQGR